MKNALTLLLSLLAMTVWAQKTSLDFELKKGKLYDGLERHESVRLTLLEETPEEIYVLRSEHKDKMHFLRQVSTIARAYEMATEKDYGRYYLERYSKDMEREESHLIFDAEKYDYDRVFLQAFEMADTFYAFFSEKDRSDKRYLYVQRLDKQSLKPVGRMSRLTSTSVFGERSRQPGTFFMQLSEDGSQLAILSTVPGVKEKKARFKVQVFGKGLQLLWEQEMKLRTPGNLFRFMDFLFDKQGNAHVLGKIYDEYETDCNKKKKTHKWVIFSMYPDGQNNKVQIDSKSDPYIFDAQLFQQDASSLMCLGLYSDVNASLTRTFAGLSRHIFSVQDLSEQSAEFIPFDKDILPEIMSPYEKRMALKRLSKGKTPYFHAPWSRTIFRNDGGFVLLFESWGNVAQSLSMASFSADGQLEWGRYMWKGEKSEKSVLSSMTNNEPPPIPFNYALAIVDDKMYFVFNDSPKNLGATLSDDEKIKSMSNDKTTWILAVQVITADGEVFPREQVADYEDLEIVANPGGYFYLTEKENALLLYGEYRENYRLFKLAFQGLFQYKRL